MRNNSLAMLATVTGVGILAWWIGYFDPATCKKDIQQPGWTSCESIAQTQNLALFAFIAVTVLAAVFITIRSAIQRKSASQAAERRFTTR